MPPTLSLVWCRVLFGCMTQFGQKLYFFQRVFLSTALWCRSLSSPMERRGVKQRADGTPLFGYLAVTEITTCRAHTECVLEYHGLRGTFCLALQLGQSLLTCPSPAGISRGLCPANVLARAKMSSTSHFVVGNKLYCKSACPEVTRRLQNLNVHGFPLWGRTSYRKVEMETR